MIYHLAQFYGQPLTGRRFMELASTLGIGMLALAASGGAEAQFPNEPAEINACLCLQQEAAALLAEKDATAQALAATNRQLSDLDAQLASERQRVDVNNPASISRYKALLERRDAAYGHF